MAPSQRRFELRDRTREGHDRLDAAVGAFGTLEAYCHYIARIGSFRATMDAALLNAVWPDEWRWRPTWVADALADDTLDLKLPPASRQKVCLDLGDESALLGTLYVLEGSTLGARVLRQRALALGLDETFGARHLALMSNDIAQWQSFLVLLDSAPDFNIERAAASANAVFAFALRCFESDCLVVQ